MWKDGIEELIVLMESNLVIINNSVPLFTCHRHIRVYFTHL